MAKIPMRKDRIVPKDRRVALPKPKVAESFYGSSEWKALRERLRKERGGRCETPGCRSHGRVTLHHIVERKDGGAPLDPKNLIFQCDPCHGAVTARNRSLRADENHAAQESSPATAASRPGEAEARSRPAAPRQIGRTIRLG